MAEIYPSEGLDLMLNIFPKGGTNLTTTYLALFTAYTATTVGTRSQGASTYTEPTFGAYAAQSIAAASWGALADQSTTGRQTTAAQVTFPTATSNSAAATNGFWLRNQLAFAASTCIFAANFDDTTAVTINTNDVIKVTPTMVAQH